MAESENVEAVKLPKGTIVKLNGFPCELAGDAYIHSSAIAGMGLEAFLQLTEHGQSLAAFQSQTS